MKIQIKQAIEKNMTSSKSLEAPEPILDKKTVKELTNREILKDEYKEFELGNDTYSMCFKSLHTVCAQKMELLPKDWQRCFQSAIFVFCIQALLLVMINLAFLDETMTIKSPTMVVTLGARFICSILMHLQVEGDVRQGQKMMKFATNHPEEFSMPKIAFMIGLMQFLGGFFCELACITFLSTLDKTIDVIIKFIALGSIAKIDDFYAAALPSENKVKKNAKKGEDAIFVSKHRRNIDRSE